MILVTVIAITSALVAWALRLMQCAVDQREFSLMLAGLLVSSAAAGLVGVYFLTSDCVSYMTTLPEMTGAPLQWSELESLERDVLYNFESSVH